MTMSFPHLLDTRLKFNSCSNKLVLVAIKLDGICREVGVRFDYGIYPRNNCRWKRGG